MIKRCLSAIAFLLVSCTTSRASEPARQCKSFLDYAGDPAFQSDERLQLLDGAGELVGFSSGRIQPRIDFVERATGPRIHRVTSADAITKEHDARASEQYGRQFQYAGWTEGDPPQVYLVMNRIPPGRLAWVTKHELVHASGVRWPTCPKGADCFHTMEADSVMCSAKVPDCKDPIDFTSADLAFCRASCLCP